MWVGLSMTNNLPPLPRDIGPLPSLRWLRLAAGEQDGSVTNIAQALGEKLYITVDGQGTPASTSTNLPYEVGLLRRSSCIGKILANVERGIPKSSQNALFV